MAYDPHDVVSITEEKVLYLTKDTYPLSSFPHFVFSDLQRVSD